MKGVSAIIAVILIVMIVVSLVGLTYTWFFGLFNSLADTTSASAETTKTSVGTIFKIESARNVTGIACCNVSTTIRNIGNPSINISRMTAYIDDEKKDIKGVTMTALRGGFTTVFNVSTSIDPKGKKLKLITETGFEQTTTIT
jgi:flagellin-like protein